MGASTAPISHLLPPPLPKHKPFKPRISSSAIQRRHLLLFSVPLSLTLEFNSRSSALSSYDPVTPAERDASITLSLRVSEAVDLLERGRQLQAQGDFDQALECFSQVVKDYKDFALSDYARVGRAIALYEVGDKDQAISEMEDVSISLKGYPEVHAALAAALYSDKHAPLLAENQFTIATLLDPHYTDLSYLKDATLIGEPEKVGIWVPILTIVQKCGWQFCRIHVKVWLSAFLSNGEKGYYYIGHLSIPKMWTIVFLGACF